MKPHDVSSKEGSESSLQDVSLLILSKVFITVSSEKAVTSVRTTNGGQYEG